MFRRRFWQIFFFVLLLLPPLWLHMLSQPYLYKATASLLIEPSQGKTGEVDGAFGLEEDAGDYLNTQLKLLHSTLLINRVIEKEDLLNSNLLDNQPAPQQYEYPPWLITVNEMLGFRKATPPTPIDPEKKNKETMEAVVTNILSNLTIQPINKSHIVELTFTARDPFLAARVVNAIARNHTGWQLEARTATMKRVSKLLVHRLESLTGSLEQAEKTLETFRKESGLVTSEEKESVEWKQLQAVNDEYSMVIAKLMESQIRIQKLDDWISSRNNRKPGLPALDNEEAISVLLRDLNRDAAQKERVITKLSERRGENYPPVIRLRKDFAKTTAAIYAEENRMLAAERHNHEISQGRMAKVEKRLAQEQKKFKEYQNKAVQLRKLEREVDANRELHAMFLKRFKETDVMGGMDLPDIQLVDAAEPPSQPFSPQFAQNTLWTVSAGFFVAVLVAFILELMDPTVKTPDEAERAIDLPLMGWVPLIPGRDPARITETMQTCTPGTAYGESLQGVRTSLMMVDVHEPVKLIMIVSCGSGEGRTTLVRSLAKVCSTNGERVLIIDADFRHPLNKKAAEEQEIRGIAGMIGQCANLGEVPSLAKPGEKQAADFHKVVMEHIEETPEGYHLLAPGVADANPTKILSSPLWPAITKLLREKYDRILVDSPPVLRFTDAQLLGVHMDAAVLLVKSAVTQKEHLLTARKRMTLSRTPLVGMVLTQLDMRKHRSELREYGHS